MKMFRAIAGSSALLALCACSYLGHPRADMATATAGIALGGPDSPGASASPSSTGAPRSRASKRAAHTAASVTITAVGDTMLGNMPDLPPDPASYFSAVKTTLAGGGGIVFGNLEGT